MYVGRPSVSADSEHSFALIAQMQATAHAASFSSSHPVDSTPDTKPRTSSVLCAAAAYRHLIGDSICNFQCPHITILSHRAALFHHHSGHESGKVLYVRFPTRNRPQLHSRFTCFSEFTGVATRYRPSCRNIFTSVLRFGVVLPDSILATDECGSPQRSASSLCESFKSWRRSIIVPTI